MFEFDASKLIIIGIVALIVIGPKDLPRVLRQLGQAMGKMRRMAAEFQGQFMEAMREADIADARAEVEKLAGAGSGRKFDPLGDIRSHLNEAVAKADAPALPATPQLASPPQSAETPADAPLSQAANAPEPKSEEVAAQMRELADALRKEIDGADDATSPAREQPAMVLTPVGLVPGRAAP
ncbi:Sec-independent protein translocase protein TatB [Methylocella sp.]|uniref:Sec-independent protein translocase protein TatB n=1 Tax=Methylocella sp. TaxID=1978226 RepID=UPI0035B09F55